LLLSSKRSLWDAFKRRRIEGKSPADVPGGKGEFAKNNSL